MANVSNRKTVQRKSYTLTRTNIIACLIIIVGTILWVYGVICGYYLGYVKDSYKTSEIKNGRYIEYDISKEQLLGGYYTELNNDIRYAPYSAVDVYTGVETYIIAAGEDSDCYIPITVTREYQDDFDKMVSGATETYHLFGKFKRYKKFNDIFGDTLSYDDVAEQLEIEDEEEAENMFSENHKIVLIDPKAERRITYEGISLILLGSLILYSSERMGKKQNNYSFVRGKMSSIEKNRKNKEMF